MSVSAIKYFDNLHTSRLGPSCVIWCTIFYAALPLYTYLYPKIQAASWSHHSTKWIVDLLPLAQGHYRCILVPRDLSIGLCYLKGSEHDRDISCWNYRVNSNLQPRGSRCGHTCRFPFACTYILMCSAGFLQKDMEADTADNALISKSVAPDTQRPCQ